VTDRDISKYHHVDRFGALRVVHFCRISTITDMTSGVPLISLDSAPLTAAAMLHGMHLLPVSLGNVAALCDAVINQFRSATEVFQPISISDIIPNEPSNRRFMFVFGLITCLYEMAKREPESFEFCTLQNSSCPSGKACTICKKVSRSNQPKTVIQMMKLHKLPETVKQVLYDLMIKVRRGTEAVKNRKKTSSDTWVQPANCKLGDHTIRSSSSLIRFLTHAKECVLKLWKELVAPNFMLLQFHLRVPDAVVVVAPRPKESVSNRLKRMCVTLPASSFSPVIGEMEEVSPESVERLSSPSYHYTMSPRVAVAAGATYSMDSPSRQVASEPLDPLTSPTYRPMSPMFDTQYGCESPTYAPVDVWGDLGDDNEKDEWDDDDDTDVCGVRLDGRAPVNRPGTLI